MQAGIATRLRAPKTGSNRGRALAACLATAGLALLAAACGPASAGSSAGSVGTTPVSGGTASYAEEPSFQIDYIFPFTNSNYIDVPNTDDFQYLLYRPLYWFGQGTSPYLNQSLSLAYPPKYQGRTVTIRLKKYYWSDGKPVTAQNVMFWINMQRDDPGEWGAQVLGDFPFNVSTFRVVNSTELQMTMTKPYSPEWFTNNELSQITPMPEYWDRTSATTASDCSTVPSACKAVYTYLDSQSKPGTMTTWAKSPLWSIVDGPWKVTSASNTGEVTMVINSRYSGHLPADHIDTLIELPFESEQAEFNVLQDPGRQPVDVGYLPTVDAPVPPPGAQTGGNPATLSNYKITAVYPWALSYFPYNYKDPTAGPIFSQQYFRESFQTLVDQEGVIDGPLHGYGKATIGPVADYPSTQYLSKKVQDAGDQWELNLPKAESLLKSHGWSIVPGGVDKCISPGPGPSNCGPGIKGGAELKFNLVYASGIDWMYSATRELQSNAQLAGIQIKATAESAGDVVGAAFCTGSGCPSWQLAEWGAWTYSPDYLPTGEELFESSSVADAGLYNNSHNNALIQDTLQAATPAAFNKAMYTWQEWLAQQLPVVYEPNAATLVENVNDLYIGPQSTTLTINPEDWHYLK
jgi:peptide/nickel transport system substrate-binding protein